MPTVRPPRPAEIREAAARHHVDLTDGEVEFFAGLIGDRMDVYRRLEELSADRRTTPHPKRDPGYRLDGDEDPYNAFIRKCEVHGADDGPLDGYEVGLKDSIAVAGVPMTGGSRLLEGYVPPEDATLAARLLDAGATITGKLNMTNLAMEATGHDSIGGPMLNPHDTDYTAGGSSGGSAAAVVTGDVDVAIGGDQGGSIRSPAAYCGCVGLKPTRGLVPYTGVMGAGPTVDHVGPMARTVEDCALTLGAIAGDDGLDPRGRGVDPDDYTDAFAEGVDDLTVGTLEEGFGVEGGDPEVDRVVREAVESLGELGAEAREVSVPWHEDGLAVWTGVIAEELAATVRGNGIGYLGPGRYDPGFAATFGTARRLVADEYPPLLKLMLVMGEYAATEYHGRYYARAQNLARELAGAYDEALAAVDVLVLPTVSATAPEFEPGLAGTGWLEYALGGVGGNRAPFNVSGHPAISVPCGAVDGLPVGMMLVGERFDETTVLRAAHAVEGTD